MVPKVIKKLLYLIASHYTSLKMRKSVIKCSLMCDHQPACPKKYYGFSASDEVSVTYH